MIDATLTIAGEKKPPKNSGLYWIRTLDLECFSLKQTKKLVRDRWSKPREIGVALFDQKKISIWTEAFHLRFNRNLGFFLCEVKVDTSMFKNGTQSFGRTGPEPVREDLLWRWTTLTRKFPLGPNSSNYFLSEIYEKFRIMESTTYCLHVKRNLHSLFSPLPVLY